MRSGDPRHGGACASQTRGGGVMYKAIMVPTKGSAMEIAAIRMALALAKRFDAELHLVRVDTAPVLMETGTVPPVLLITEETLREGRSERQRQLEEAGAAW